jgi:hypothetical protein
LVIIPLSSSWRATGRRSRRSSKDKSVKVFEKGKDKKEDIDKELKKFKEDFDIEKFGAVRP